MGSQQRNVNLSSKLPIKSGGGYFMSNNNIPTMKTEFNPYQKYMDGLQKKKKTKSKGKKKK